MSQFVFFFFLSPGNLLLPTELVVWEKWNPAVPQDRSRDNSVLRSAGVNGISEAGEEGSS